MFLLFVIVLLLAAAAGMLGFVLKVAVGVALGLFFGVLLLGAFIAWRVRRAFGRAIGQTQDGRRRWRQIPDSTVEVLGREDPHRI